jgi:ABC-type multidrug transport system fused ATPase/permease subunit
MRLVGWKTAAYFSLSIVSVVGAVFVVIFFRTDRTVSINTGFYVAVAQILPILLLTQFVRASSMRDLLFALHDDVEESRRTISERLDELRSDSERDRVDGALSRKVNEAEKELRQNDLRGRLAGLLAELVAAMVFVALVLGFVGGGAALAVLATGKSDSLIFFLLTLAALIWTALGLLVFEGLIFTAPRVAAERAAR